MTKQTFIKRAIAIVVLANGPSIVNMIFHFMFSFLFKTYTEAYLFGFGATTIVALIVGVILLLKWAFDSK